MGCSCATALMPPCSWCTSHLEGCHWPDQECTCDELKEIDWSGDRVTIIGPVTDPKGLDAAGFEEFGSIRHGKLLIAPDEAVMWLRGLLDLGAILIIERKDQDPRAWQMGAGGEFNRLVAPITQVSDVPQFSSPEEADAWMAGKQDALWSSERVLQLLDRATLAGTPQASIRAVRKASGLPNGVAKELVLEARRKLGIGQMGPS